MYIFYLKVMTFAPKNINMLRISPLTVLAHLWLLSGMKNPFTVGKLQNTSCTGLKIIFYCPRTKATNLANLLNWTTAVSLKQIRTICQQPPAKAFKSWPRNWSKTVNLHLGFQILDFPSCPPTFPQCLCIEEFQSKYHRGEQIWAQIWQNQKMELFKLPFSEVLKSPSKSLFCKENVTSSFFWGCHPSPLLSNVRVALALSWFHLHDFFGIFAVARFSSEGFLQQSRKHGWVPLYFTFSLILPSSASSQMQFQVCISSNKTIEVFSGCFNFSKNYFWVI